MDATDQMQRLQRGINGLRASGFAGWPPTTALTIEPRLVRAAHGHARYLADDDRLDHVDDRGRDGPMRVSAVGYAWRRAGETIARGQPDADAVLLSWRDSPGHCAVLLEPDYVHFGLALAFPSPHSTPPPPYPTYWVAVFASPL